MWSLKQLKKTKIITIILFLLIYKFWTFKINLPSFLHFTCNGSSSTGAWICNTLKNDSEMYNIKTQSSISECRHFQNIDLLVAAISTISNRVQRNQIRQSWNGANKTGTYWHLCNNTEMCYWMKERVKIVFIVGLTTNLLLQKQLDAEQNQHGDIIQGTFLDHYRNLTLKSLLMIHWWKTYCPSAQFLLKIDDNVYLNLSIMLETIASVNRNSYRHGFIAGYTVAVHPVNRRKSSKFYVPQWQYKNFNYPGHVAGPAYVISREAVEFLWKASVKIPKIHIEDIYLTGLCREAANVDMVNRTEFCSRVRVKHHISGCASEHRQ